MKAYQKTDYLIHAEIVSINTKVYNSLEDSTGTSAEGHDVKLIGTVNEEWLIDREQLPKKYTYPDKKPIVLNDLPEGIFEIQAIAGAEIIWAEQVHDQRKVKTSWGETLTANLPGREHGSGDYIVCSDDDGKPNHEDRWIVNGKVFETTYVPAKQNETSLQMNVKNTSSKDE